MKALDRIITGAKRMALPAVAVLGSYLGNPAYSQETETEKPLVAYVQQDKTNNSREVKEEKLEGESNIGKDLPTTPKIVFYRGYKDLNKDEKPQWNELVGVSDYADKEDKNAIVYAFIPKEYFKEGENKIELCEYATLGEFQEVFEKTNKEKFDFSEEQKKEKTEMGYYEKIIKERENFQMPIEGDYLENREKSLKPSIIYKILRKETREFFLKINGEEKSSKKLFIKD
jgi:hypothetical protein